MVEKSETISNDIWNILDDTDNQCYISTVSIQEIFMLMRDNKLNIKYWRKPTDVPLLWTKFLDFKQYFLKKTKKTLASFGNTR